MAERANLGYGISALMFGGLIAAVCIGRFGFRVNAVLSFWIAYILTRPLGASLGDLFSQPRDSGGLGAGTAVTSGLFLGAILALVVYLAVTRADVTGADAAGTADEVHSDEITSGAR